MQYPKTKTVDHIDNYHGTQVADPYRWLEDLDADETKAWIEAQNRVTFAYLEEIPQRQKIQERLTQLWNYEKYGTPFRRGNRYFYFKNDGLQNHSVLYTLQSLDEQPQVLLDPIPFPKMVRWLCLVFPLATTVAGLPTVCLRVGLTGNNGKSAISKPAKI
jgi:prolyl oligopeptidase